MPPNVKLTKQRLPKTEKERGEARVQNFLDMSMPSVIKFFPDHYISGNTFRCCYAIREYPTETSQQALLRHIGEKSGITLAVYSRHVTPMEERKILQNASSKNRLQRTNSNDIRQNILAEENLKDMAEMIADNRKNKDVLLHCAVFIELSAFTLEALRELQIDVQAELTRAKISFDRLFIRQDEGYKSVNPFGYNVFKEQLATVQNLIKRDE